jgi:3'-5' exoribonuclease
VAQLSPGARAFLDVVLDHVGRDAYDRMAAAERMHHACVGGLKWHSIEVCELALSHARAMPQYTPQLSVDALICGAALHDVGKVSEMSVDRGVGIRRAPLGWARYHTTLGSQLIAVACALHADRLRDAGTSPVLIDHTMHVVESHHATKEFGSPTPPRSMEAWLIHCADLASARLRELTDALAGRTVDASGWCGLQDAGKTPVFAPGLCGPTPAGDDAGAVPPPPQTPERTLDLIVLRPASPIITPSQEHA